MESWLFELLRGANIFIMSIFLFVLLPALHLRVAPPARKSPHTAQNFEDKLFLTSLAEAKECNEKIRVA